MYFIGTIYHLTIVTVCDLQNDSINYRHVTFTKVRGQTLTGHWLCTAVMILDRCQDILVYVPKRTETLQMAIEIKTTETIWHLKTLTG